MSLRTFLSGPVLQAGHRSSRGTWPAPSLRPPRHRRPPPDQPREAKEHCLGQGNALSRLPRYGAPILRVDRESTEGLRHRGPTAPWQEPTVREPRISAGEPRQELISPELKVPEESRRISTRGMAILEAQQCGRATLDMPAGKAGRVNTDLVIRLGKGRECIKGGLTECRHAVQGRNFSSIPRYWM